MWKTINLCFAAINKFKSEGIKDYYIRERRIVGDLQFQFYQPQSAKITSQLLASKLDLWDEENMKCSPNDLIYRQYCCKLDGKEELVKQYLDALKPRDCYIISRNKAYGDRKDLKTEEIYGSQFAVEPMPEG